MLNCVFQKFSLKILPKQTLRYISISKSVLSDTKKDTSKDNKTITKTCSKQEKEPDCPDFKGKSGKPDIDLCKPAKPKQGIDEAPICGDTVCKIESVKKEKKEEKEEKKEEIEESVPPKEKPEILEDIIIEPVVSGNYNNYKVVIVGAGLAGLSAAKFLQDNNIQNFTVLEAGSRPGGRIHSEWFSDAVVELGSSCQRESIVCDKFLQTAIVEGIIKPPLSFLSIFSPSDGHCISPTMSLIALDIFKRIYCESLELESNALDYINFRIEQEIEDFPLNIRADIARIMIGLLAFRYKKEGDNLQRFIHHDKGMTYLQSPGGSLKVPLGLSGLLPPMLNAIPQENILYNKPVQNIRWGAVVCKDTPRAMVKCLDGTVYPADFVLVTVSLGVLKENYDNLFCPLLPAEKISAINRLEYNHCNNIFVCFNEPIWMWVSQAVDYNFTKSDAQYFGSWMSGIRCIKQVLGSNYVLSVSVYGNEAKAVEKLDDCTLLKGLMCTIENEIPLNFVPTVKSLLRTRWTGNVYFNGAYSQQPPGVPDKVLNQLGSPLPGNNAPVNPILFFAGEATCPKLFGTIQGAKISGVREAARIKQVIAASSTSDDKLPLSSVQCFN